MKKEKYSIIYQKIDDPSCEEVEQLITILESNNIVIEDQIHGTFLVEGLEADIEKTIQNFDMWKYSLVKNIKI